jgi:hypothetical protein
MMETDILEEGVIQRVGLLANLREKIFIPNLSNSDGGDAKVRSRQPWWWS